MALQLLFGQALSQSWKTQQLGKSVDSKLEASATPNETKLPMTTRAGKYIERNIDKRRGSCISRIIALSLHRQLGRSRQDLRSSWHGLDRRAG